MFSSKLTFQKCYKVILIIREMVVAHIEGGK
jgi:hypothetical protein